MEEIVYGEHVFQIPAGLKEDYSCLLEIISPDTWNNVLTDAHRQQLMKYLPDFPDEDLKNKTQTLELYFMNENFHFGSPLQKFFANLNKGFFNPNIAKQRKIKRKILLKSYRYRQKQYYHKLLEEMVISRKNIIEGVRTCGSLPDTLLIRPPTNKMDRQEACIQRARKRYFRELKSIKTEAGCDSEMSEDENYPEGPGISINKKQRRQLALLETSFPSTLCLVRGTFSRGSLALDLEARFNSFENPFDTSDEHLRNIIANHIIKRKKNSIATAVRGVTMHGILERTQLYSKKPLQRPHSLSLPLPSSDKPSSIPNAKKSSLLRKKLKPILKEKLSYNFSVPPALGRDLCAKSNGIGLSAVIKEISTDESSSEEEIENFVKIKTEDVETMQNLEDERSLFAPELTQETHISFFSLLRDVICSTAHQRMSKQQLENSIKNWQDSAISPLNEWFCLSESWVENLPSSINFLCGNLSLDILPSDFVPFIEHKINSKCFQWIGAGRDIDSNLEPLCQFWLSNRNGIINKWPTAVNNTVTADETKSSVTKNVTVPGWSLSPSVASPDNEYHIQERLRYGSPHKAFTYRMNGYESIIGPVKGVYSQQVGSSSKARDHTLLISNRPPYVTILSLVWDAVSRLPNGEGTKIDICKLVKESQFIIQISSSALESTLTNVVSGALDRLQNEKDPCVKFDTSRKLWVYLHSNRTEEEFERIHHMNGPLSGSKVKSLGSSRKQKSKKEDLEKGPPNVAMEQFSTAIKQMDGSEVRVKDEDLLKNWVKISTAPMKKNETVKITSSQLRADLAKMKAANAKAAAAESAVDGNNFTSKNQPLSFKTPLVQSAPVKKIAVSPTAIVPQIVTHTEDVPSSVPTSKTCSTLQLAKRGKLIQSAPFSTISTKPTVNTQGARKYHSASEKKRQTGVLPVTIPSTVSESSPAISTSISNAKVTKSPAEVTPVSGIKLLQYSSQNVQGGRFIQIAAVDSGTSSGFQKVTLVPQFTQASITNNDQKGVDVTKKFTTTGIKTTMASGELKLKLRGPTTFTTASGNITGNLISLGGKQIFLATKGSNSNKPNTQFQQVVVGEAGTSRIENVRRTIGSVQQLHIAQNSGVQSSSSGQSVFVSTSTHPAQQHIIVPVSTTGQQIVVPATNQQIVVPANAGGQQIMVPASALHGSPINLKRLQTFQSFKVVPASHLTSQQKGKPMVAHILAPSSSQTVQSGTTKLSLHVTKDGQTFERK